MLISLGLLQFRPSSAKKTIILATKARKEGYSNVKMMQDLIRFDVDPKVGRDVLLYICLAFQAASKFRLGNPQIWNETFERGNVEEGKDLIQRYIEGNRGLRTLSRVMRYRISVIPYTILQYECCDV